MFMSLLSVLSKSEQDQYTIDTVSADRNLKHLHKWLEDRHSRDIAYSQVEDTRRWERCTRSANGGSKDGGGDLKTFNKEYKRLLAKAKAAGMLRDDKYLFAHYVKAVDLGPSFVNGFELHRAHSEKLAKLTARLEQVDYVEINELECLAEYSESKEDLIVRQATLRMRSGLQGMPNGAQPKGDQKGGRGRDGRRRHGVAFAALGDGDGEDECNMTSSPRAKKKKPNKDFLKAGTVVGQYEENGVPCCLTADGKGGIRKDGKPFGKPSTPYKGKGSKLPVPPTSTCRDGANCSFLKKGHCKFTHTQSDILKAQSSKSSDRNRSSSPNQTHKPKKSGGGKGDKKGGNGGKKDVKKDGKNKKKGDGKTPGGIDRPCLNPKCEGIGKSPKWDPQPGPVNVYKRNMECHICKMACARVEPSR